MNNFFRLFTPDSHWGTSDWVAFFIMLVFVVIVGFIVFLFLSWVFKILAYDFSYSKPFEHKGEVVEMEYVPPKTTTTYNGKTTTTSTTPEKNIVIFKTSIATTRLDSDKLYQRVRIGESITVKSQSEYSKPKYWEGKWELEGERLISITSEKNQTVTFNKEMPANYRGNQ